MHPCLTHPFSTSRSEKRALSSLCRNKGDRRCWAFSRRCCALHDYRRRFGLRFRRRLLNRTSIYTAREARRDHAHSSLATLRIARHHRSRRALRHSHRTARGLRIIAPRTRHLRFNHFTRPPRRRRTETCSSAEPLDGLALRGGYNGTQIFLQLKLDASKRDITNKK